MKTPRFLREVGARAGGTLLVALLTITTLSIAVGAFVMSVRNRSHIAFQSASWNQASLAAESAGDLALAELRKVMPELGARPAGTWVGWTNASGAVAERTAVVAGALMGPMFPPPLVHGGEGNTVQSASVTIDAPATLIHRTAQRDLQWLRIRAKGVANVPGPPRLSPEKLDLALRQLAFVKERGGEFVTAPRAYRTIEMVVRPVLPFEAALTSPGAITFTHGSSLVDSFDSSDPAKSTSGQYDFNKRQRNGTVQTNGSSFTFAGEVRGRIETNGANVAANSRFLGDIDNQSHVPLPTISGPPGGSFTVENGTGNLAVSAGTVAAPRRIRVSTLSAHLNISSSSAGAVELWVDGNLTGKVTVPTNVSLKIYVGGNVDTKASDLVNNSRLAANLQIYGLAPATGAPVPSIEIKLDGDLHAAVYAPSHDFTFTHHQGDAFGSFTGRTFTANNRARIYRDEALRHAGQIIDYRVASWVELP